MSHALFCVVTVHYNTKVLSCTNNMLNVHLDPRPAPLPLILTARGLEHAGKRILFPFDITTLCPRNTNDGSYGYNLAQDVWDENQKILLAQGAYVLPYLSYDDFISQRL